MDITTADELRMKKAEKIVPFLQSEAYLGYIRPFLINLAQEGYPKPADYTDEHKLMMDYIRKCGETDAVKKIMKELEEQPAIQEAIEKKYSEEKEGVV